MVTDNEEPTFPCGCCRDYLSIYPKLKITVYSSDGKTSNTITISFSLNAADSAALLNDIKNILANDVNIETNALGAIT